MWAASARWRQSQDLEFRSFPHASKIADGNIVGAGHTKAKSVWAFSIFACNTVDRSYLCKLLFALSKHVPSVNKVLRAPIFFAPP